MKEPDPRSTFDPARPLKPAEARRLINEIRNSGLAHWISDHAVKRLEEKGMDMMDVANVLRCGREIDGPEPHPVTGAWTYRVHTDLMCVVIEFTDGPRIRIITGWRKRSSI